MFTLVYKNPLVIRFNCGQIHDELTGAYMDKVLFSYGTVARWIQRFANGREAVEDDCRMNRPSSIITQRNIDAVQDLIKKASHISIDYIATTLDISLMVVLIQFLNNIPPYERYRQDGYLTS